MKWIAAGFVLFPLLVFADTVHWGEPVNGLRLGVESPVTSATSDQNLGFRVTALNVSDRPIVLPAPDSFVPLASPQSEDYHVFPLTPLVKSTRVDPKPSDGESPWSLGESGKPVSEAAKGVIELAPGESRSWDAVPLKKHFYFGDRLPPSERTTVQTWFLLPGHNFEIGFRFENERKRLAGRNDLWTGRADSGLAEVTVNAPSTEGLKIEGDFSLPKTTYFLGEPIEATFTVRNSGDGPLDFPAGSDYRGSGRHDRFTIHAVDARGDAVPDPVLPSGFGGGLGGHRRVVPGEPYTEKVLINQWCGFSRPGKYRVTCQRTLGILRPGQPDPYTTPESSLPAIPITATFEITILDDAPALSASLEKLISSPKEIGRQSEYLRSLAQAQIPTAFPMIVKLLDGPPELQSQAVEWLRNYGSEKASSLLLERAPQLEPRARYAALRALCDWKTPGVGLLLGAALRDKNLELRSNAVLLCTRGWYADCIPILLKMGDDPDPLVRRYLGAALGVCGDPRAVPVLLELLNDAKDSQVQIWAAQGLGKWKNPEAVPAMIRLLRDPKVRGSEGNIIAILQELTGEKFETRKAWLDWWEKSASREAAQRLWRYRKSATNQRTP